MSANDYRKQLAGCQTEQELRRVLAVWHAVEAEPAEWPGLRAAAMETMERIENSQSAIGNSQREAAACS